MTEDLFDPDPDATVDEEVVKRQQDKLRDFIKDLTGDDIKSGNWFTKLVAHALNQYTTRVDWEYFQQKYAGIPADGIVDARTKMAARYAAVEGGLSAAAYTATISATIGSLGGASPLTVPAAVTTVLVDVLFVTQLQLRLAYDIAVLYRVSIDLDDPGDLWKLIRVAFTIKGGEVVREGAIKGVPLFVRPFIKHFYRGPVLAAARSLPVVGRHLLQRNLIKIGIPLVGVPLSVVVNRYTTLAAGRHARAVFRDEARIIELAGRLSDRTRHPQTLLWVAWMVVMADDNISDEETLLMRHLVQTVRADHGVVDEALNHLVDIEPVEVWARVGAEVGNLQDLADAATQVASVDGPTNKREQAILDEFADRLEPLSGTFR